MVAAVCTITTIVISRLNGTSRAQRSREISGNDGTGSDAGTAPTTCTPRCSRSAVITASVAAISPISAPGILALIASDSGDHGQHAEADHDREDVGVAKVLRQHRHARRASVRLVAGNPSTPGICDTTMCTEMPARKPTVTGVDNKLAMPPRRNTPLAVSITPTIKASATASAW